LGTGADAAVATTTLRWPNPAVGNRKGDDDAQGFESHASETVAIEGFEGHFEKLEGG
jgi:hypothetical protein